MAWHPHKGQQAKQHCTDSSSKEAVHREKNVGTVFSGIKVHSEDWWWRYLQAFQKEQLYIVLMTGAQGEVL